MINKAIKIRQDFHKLRTRAAIFCGGTADKRQISSNFKQITPFAPYLTAIRPGSIDLNTQIKSSGDSSNLIIYLCHNEFY